jgi:hypothetical protein
VARSWKEDENLHEWEEKGVPSGFDETPLSVETVFLRYLHVYSSRTFLTLLYIERNPVAFIQRFEAGRIYSGMMNKYIRSVLLLNKAVAFTVIEPFHDSISHSDTLLSDNFSRFFTSGRATFDKWYPFITKQARP